MKTTYKILFLIIAMIGMFFIGKSLGDPNRKMTFGPQGDPKNCRAIIYKNYEGYVMEQYKAEEALSSIYRNCGDNGYSWGR